jgi:hypothetical protein
MSFLPISLRKQVLYFLLITQTYACIFMQYLVVINFSYKILQIDTAYVNKIIHK